jgi:cell division protein FtsQ
LKIKPFILQNLKRVAWVLGILGLVAFAGNRQQNRRCPRLDIRIEEQYGNYFVDNQDVINLLTNNGRDAVIGTPQKALAFKDLEKRLKTNKFVQDCQVAGSLNGDLLIFIRQSRPIARIIHRSAPDFYLSEKGEVLPLSDNFTARVLTVETADPQLFMPATPVAKAETELYFLVMQTIDQSRFWKAQIAQMSINQTGEIVFQPQIGKQIIEFGKPGDEAEIADKFRRLDLFYRKIIPAKGWNAYSRVSVAFEKQIVCQ